MAINKIMEITQKQEEALRFDHFDYADALDLGMLIVNRAKEKSFPILVEITINGYQVFRYGFAGTSSFNSTWMGLKRNTVDTFLKSSLYVYGWLKADNIDLSQHFHLDPMRQGPMGGGFPIHVSGVGVVGSITVSGLSHLEDHDLIVDMLCKYLDVNVERIYDEA